MNRHMLNSFKLAVNVDFFSEPVDFQVPEKLLEKIRLWLQLVKTSGFGRVLLSCNAFMYFNANRKVRKQYISVVRESGLGVDQLHSHDFHLEEIQDVRRIDDITRAIVDEAVMVNSKEIVIHSLKADRNITYDQWQSANLDMIHRYHRVMPRSMRLAVENDGYSPDLPSYNWDMNSLASLIDAYDHDGVGLCFDTTHLMSTGVTLSQGIHLAGKRIASVHLHDMPGPFVEGQKRKEAHGLPGTGCCDLDELFVSLKNIEFKGPIIFEVGRIRGSQEQQIDALTRARILTEKKIQESSSSESLICRTNGHTSRL